MIIPGFQGQLSQDMSDRIYFIIVSRYSRSTLIFLRILNRDSMSEYVTVSGDSIKQIEPYKIMTKGLL